MRSWLMLILATVVICGGCGQAARLEKEKAEARLQQRHKDFQQAVLDIHAVCKIEQPTWTDKRLMSKAVARLQDSAKDIFLRDDYSDLAHVSGDLFTAYIELPSTQLRYGDVVDDFYYEAWATAKAEYEALLKKLDLRRKAEK